MRCRPQIYEETLAKSAEEYGPLANKTMERLQEMDKAMEHLDSRLTVTKMKEWVNVVVLSDHGKKFFNVPNHTKLDCKT